MQVSGPDPKGVKAKRAPFHAASRDGTTSVSVSGGSCDLITIFQHLSFNVVASGSPQYVMMKCWGDPVTMLRRPGNARHPGSIRGRMHCCVPCTAYAALPAASKQFPARPFWPGSPGTHSKDQACSHPASLMHAHAACATMFLALSNFTISC